MIQKIKKIFRPIYVKPISFCLEFIPNLKKRKTLSAVKKHFAEIKNYHNCHIGQRCYIIGNGPSLKSEDLERLKGQICFGTHRIYLIFDKVDWRPTYYFAQDYALIKNSWNEIFENVECKKFIGLTQYQIYEKLKCVKLLGRQPKDYYESKNAIFAQMIQEEFYPNIPQFSEDFSMGFYEGYTVSYMCLQMAMYMGFKEIILLGVDHSYANDMLPDGRVINKDVADHFSNDDLITNIPQTYKSSLAYISASEYAKKNNIRILNATRGGNLDVFERVDLDTIL